MDKFWDKVHDALDAIFKPFALIIYGLIMALALLVTPDPKPTKREDDEEDTE